MFKNCVFHFQDGLGSGGRTGLEFFKLMFPNSIVTDMMQGTNSALGEAGKQLLTKDECWRWVACLLLMAVYPWGSRMAWWSKPRAGEIVPKPNLQVTAGMSRHRFQDILQFLKWTDYTEEERKINEWIEVDSLIEAFNSTRQKVMTPGLISVCPLR